jgi:hypothetical protein
LGEIARMNVSVSLRTTFTSERNPIMGDKGGKKDKDKSQKQKAAKQQAKAKKPSK